ncbi:hypothetical protein [Bradyrhizobium cosmicum]|uniref:hypothetical protein n=1 Tax=Bradyrhizobium cosmicum TaxID=1404864 RepID=UPI0028EA0594|nr:hypothetical protein [Bradyrhizobium cosmicum]
MFRAWSYDRATASPDRIGPSTGLRITASSAQGHGGTYHQWIEMCCWLIGITACGLAVSLILTLGVAIEAHSLAVSIALMAFFIFIYIFYGTWRPAPILSNISGAVAIFSSQLEWLELWAWLACDATCP